MALAAAVLVAFPDLPGWITEENIRAVVLRAGPWGPLLVAARLTGM